jgi:hypothetical protein
LPKDINSWIEVEKKIKSSSHIFMFLDHSSTCEIMCTKSNSKRLKVISNYYLLTCWFASKRVGLKKGSFTQLDRWMMIIFIHKCNFVHVAECHYSITFFFSISIFIHRVSFYHPFYQLHWCLNFHLWNSFSFICNLIYVVNFIVIGFCLSHQFHPLCVGFPLMFNLILELQFHPCCWSSFNDSFTHTWVYVINLIHNHDLFICSITCDKFHQWNFHKHNVKN